MTSDLRYNLRALEMAAWPLKSVHPLSHLDRAYASVQQPKRLGGQVHASNVKTQECLKGSWDLVTRVIRRVANYTSNNL